ncbi:response regulator [Beduinella massiliensis]|uniref:response regulator n=1 Tax=Beduinella massiliensis TaxID=1852363 RepID=UPI000C85B5DD
MIFFSEDVEAGEGTQGLTPFVPAPLYRGRLCRVLRALKAGDDPAQAAEGGNAKLLDKRILLVEDNELNREIALEMIGVLGVSIDCAHDGVEAVERVASSPVGTYDLILMDIQMPRMDGYEAVRRIRALDRPDAADIPIIAMTANAFAEDVQAALRAGMNGHMSKPIDPDALSGMLRKWLS